tara:strand:+ start:685 stop:915 length:231 start_codon:yes stop_codon:yes gene_type:complete
MKEIKDKLFLFFYDQGGFSHIQFWKEVTMDEIEELTEEYGSLQEAALEDIVPVYLFWVVTDTDLERMRDEINEVLK